MRVIPSILLACRILALHRTKCHAFLARDAFIRTNRRAIAMMFVCLSICLSDTGVHCDHTVHVSADVSL